MSIIVAVTKRNKTVIACDSLYLTGSHKDYSNDLVDRSKILTLGGSYIGMTGWALYQNILNHYFAGIKRAPSLKTEAAVFEFFLKFWQVLRDKYPFVKETRDGGDSPFSDLDSSFLVANKHGIFDVHGNLTVWRHKEYCAIGSGSPYAYGALHTTYDATSSAKSIATTGVEAAIRFDDSCGGDIQVFTLK
jgi:ATP-dependent HslUV protease, peptidase subunit HslV